MKTHIKNLEIRNNRQKGEYIKNFLRGKNISFFTQPFKTLLARGENIIVDYPFHKTTSNKKIFLTAHYNAWFRTPGANDNGSGVAVLLGFLEKLVKEQKNFPIRFVFFDLEDGLAVRGGSRQYVKQFGISDVEKVYNLEMVGMGRMLLLWPSKEKMGDWLLPLIHNAEKLKFEIVHYPETRISLTAKRGFTSDHVSFIEAGCKQVCSLTTFPKDDMPFFQQILAGKEKFKFVIGLLKYHFFGKGKIPKVLQHYHNRDDRSEFIEEHNLENMLELLWKIN